METLVCETFKQATSITASDCTIVACLVSRRVLSETSAGRRQLSDTTIDAKVEFDIPTAQKDALKNAIGNLSPSDVVTAMTAALAQPAVIAKMTSELGAVPPAPTVSDILTTSFSASEVSVPQLTTGTWTAMMYTDAACTTAASPASATGAIGSGCVSGLGGNIKVAMCSNEVTASLYSDTNCNTPTGAIVVHSTTSKFRPTICEKFSSTVYLKFTCAAAGGSTSGAVGTGLSALATIAGLLMM